MSQRKMMIHDREGRGLRKMELFDPAPQISMLLAGSGRRQSHVNIEIRGRACEFSSDIASRQRWCRR